MGLEVSSASDQKETADGMTAETLLAVGKPDRNTHYVPNSSPVEGHLTAPGVLGMGLQLRNTFTVVEGVKS